MKKFGWIVAATLTLNLAQAATTQKATPQEGDKLTKGTAPAPVKKPAPAKKITTKTTPKVTTYNSVSIENGKQKTRKYKKVETLEVTKSAPQANSLSTTTNTNIYEKNSQSTATSGVPGAANPVPNITPIHDNERFRLSYFGEFSGPAIGNVTSNQASPTGLGDAGPIDMYNQVTVGWMLTNKVKLYLQPRFMIVPVAGNDFGTWMDPRLGVGHGAIIDTPNFKINGIVDVQLPMSNASQADAIIMVPRIAQTATWSIPNSRWTLGADYFVRWHMSRNPNYEGIDLRFYGGPFVGYQISPTFSMSLLYEINAAHYRDEPLSVIRRTGDNSTDLYLSASWDVTPKFNFTPFLKFFPHDRLAADATMLGFQTTATIF